MTMRVIEMVLPDEESEEVRDLLQEHTVLEHRHIELANGQVLVRIL